MTAPPEAAVPAPLPPASPAAVDASSSQRVLCPLCDYDLRGLAEPRCPECGYQFTWEELRDRERRHPYLFEHHPERSVRALRRTFLGSLRPRRFWAEVRPTHEIRPRRLVLYWGLVTALMLVPYLLIVAQAVVEVDQSYRSMRARWTAAWASGVPTAPVIRQYGSLQAALDAQWPVLPSPRVVWVALAGWRPPAVLLLGVVTLAWPWLTLAALLVFKISMNRAKVRASHVLRCVIYSADGAVVGVLVAVVFAALTAWMPYAAGTGVPWLWAYVDAMFIAFCGAIFMLAVLTYRLWIAYRKYLRFPHALATVAASQVMVALLVLKFALDWRFLR